ncbi:uncharacterized protein LOC143293326 [Babylonia areolata]|uniref:uncharacterized protein LOC143293326 n=1 Tax=Babylonia areolata TaxID=304850 RepID=UPI003FD50A8A
MMPYYQDQQQQQQQACNPTAPPDNYSNTIPAVQPPPPPPPPQSPPPHQPQPQQQQLQQQTMMPMGTYQATGSPTFRRISVRNVEFKIGFGGLFLSTCLFIVGFSVPSWTNSTGLWKICDRYDNCRSNVGVGPPWLDAVRSMETLALLCFLVCLAVVLYEEVFRHPPPPETRAVEVLAALAGIFGLIGVAIFGAKFPASRRGYGYSWFNARLDWGYGLAAAGSILGLLCAVPVAHSRSAHAAHTRLALAQAGIVIPDRQNSAHHVPTMMSPYTLPAANPMQPPPPMGYPPPLMTPYPYQYPCSANPYPYPYTYPALAVPPTNAPQTSGQEAPTSQVPSGAGAAPTSQVPVFFVMTHGRALPVYDRLPPGADTSLPVS